MKAIRIQRAGGPEALELAEVTLAAPGPGEALVKQTAVGVNFIDVYHRTGLYPLPLPSGIGQEAAGVVEAIGEGVSEVAVGDRVAYASAGTGSYRVKASMARVARATRSSAVIDAMCGFAGSPPTTARPVRRAPSFSDGLPEPRAQLNACTG